MLELLAKKHFLLPNKVYEVDWMFQMICQQDRKSMPDDLLAQVGQLSTEEWRRYRKYQQKIQNERTKPFILKNCCKKNVRIVCSVNCLNSQLTHY